MTPRLPTEDRDTLLRLARASIADAVRGDGSLDATLASIDLTPAMREERATFVTIRKTVAGTAQLRGCIGNMTPEEPLYRSVIDNARRSALHDPRFPRMEAAELDAVHLEISVLTRPEPVDGAEDIVVGRDGVELEKPPYRAVFLPQVAPEQGWDRDTMLENLAMKAGLPRDGWKDAKFLVFQAAAFSEGESG